MSDALVAEVRGYLRSFEATQQELGELYRRKRTALVRAEADELMRITESEAKLALELKDQLGRRRQILQQSKEAGLPDESIRALVSALHPDVRDELQLQIERAHATASEVRRESWIHFIIAQRSLHHFNELTDLIAHCGQKAPTYSRARGHEATSGGAILDASA